MIVYKCDICGCDIPKVKKRNILGEEIEVFDTGKLKCEQIQIPPEYLNKDFHMCKACAKGQSALIDYELMKLKTEILPIRSILK